MQENKAKIVQERDLPRSLELGCGYDTPDGAWGVDIADTEAADQCFDLDEEEWPLPSNYFRHIRAMDVLEHLENPVNFLEEIHRVAEPGATVEIKTPHFTSADVGGDLTHKRGLSVTALDDFTENAQWGFLSDARFEIAEREIRFRPLHVQPHKNLGSFIANRFPQLYENTFLSRLFPAADVYFELEVLDENRLSHRDKLRQIGELESARRLRR